MTFDTTVPSVLVTACCAPIDVVVQPRLQRAGLRAGEERDRHALHVVEERDAQVVDQPFADARRVVALHAATASALANARPTARQRDDASRGARFVLAEWRVSIRDLHQQRRDRGRDRVEHHRDDEPDQRPLGTGGRSPRTRRIVAAVDPALRIASSRRKPMIVRWFIIRAARVPAAALGPRFRLRLECAA